MDVVLWGTIKRCGPYSTWHWYPCTTKELRICTFYRRGHSISLLRMLECSLHMGFKVLTNVWLTSGKTSGGNTSFCCWSRGPSTIVLFASSQCGMFPTYTKLLTDWVLLRTNGKMDILDLSRILKTTARRIYRIQTYLSSIQHKTLIQYRFLVDSSQVT